MNAPTLSDENVARLREALISLEGAQRAVFEVTRWGDAPQDVGAALRSIVHAKYLLKGQKGVES